MHCSIAGAFFDVVNTLAEEHKTPRDYGTGHLLYHAEVRFLDMVHENPALKAGDLSQQLGVTGGAVTQMANRLTEKGLLERYTAAGNRKEKFFRLTEAGQAARQGHLACHAEANQRLCAYFRALSPEQAETILRFMEMLRDTMPICAFQCGGNEEDPCAARTLTNDKEALCSN